ncbi:CAAX amino protease [Halobacillus andaensis]|uniref:CAAX amino protease n=1 Tax=Halobacillus andaensis TaxID=1176239 RepID=A0A917ET19_HALAA|nr:CPBP family intramembrane glutamic endopeptidase [Halobacillus andaensis]MBP2003237.1 membrane protease YdiL (CAAX protease family) [Halobacillus andaensis]GGF09141.1 CAAX amino protease [Halobacillus andaensis]
MTKRSQSDLINQLSSREITKHLIITQIILFLIAILASIVLFQTPIKTWFSLFSIQITDVILFGVLPAVLIVSIDFTLMKLLPERYYDDGGINQKVFQNHGILNIFWLTLLIAFCEEALFRGVIQTSFGYFTASTLFALIHFRYLKKLVLLISVLFVSYFLGYMFEITGNLLVTITSHFLIDFILGVWISLRNGRGQSD